MACGKLPSLHPLCVLPVKVSPNARMFLHKLCHLYNMLVRLASDYAKIAIVFGPGGQPMRDRDGILIQQFDAFALRGAPKTSSC